MAADEPKPLYRHGALLSWLDYLEGRPYRETRTTRVLARIDDWFSAKSSRAFILFLVVGVPLVGLCVYKILATVWRLRFN